MSKVPISEVFRTQQKEALVELRAKYPNGFAFSEEGNYDATLPQRLLEYRLENIVNQAADILERRRSGPTMGKKATLILPSTTRELRDVLAYRKERSEAITAMHRMPEPPALVLEADTLSLEFEIASQKESDFDLIYDVLVNYFERHKKSLVVKKYKQLLRWSRFCRGCDDYERSVESLREHVQMIDTQLAIASDRLQRLCGRPSEVGEDIEEGKLQLHEGILDATDIQYYLRQKITLDSSAQKMQRFFKRIQWMPYTNRYEISRRLRHMKQAALNEKAGNNNGVPVLSSNSRSILGQLDELKSHFELTADAEKSDGLELFYQANKRFLHIFQNQSAANDMLVYDEALKSSRSSPTIIEKEGKDSAKSANVEDTKEQPPADPTKTYIKECPWIPFVKWHASISDSQELQSARFDQLRKVDHNLKVELSFLENDESQYVMKRLKDFVDSYMMRISVANRQKPLDESQKYMIASTMFQQNKEAKEANTAAAAATKKTGKQAAKVDTIQMPIGVSTHNLLSFALLRHARARSFRRRILGVLNYFRSIERKLTFDQHGYVKNKRYHPAKFFVGSEGESGSVQDGFGDARHSVFELPSDVSSNDEDVISGKLDLDVNREDSYVIDSEGQFVIVRDFADIPVMYDGAISDMRNLQTELLQIGTFFVNKKKDSMNTFVIDSAAVVSDLLESECWFIETKKKIMDCYLEIYEHTCDVNEMESLAQRMIDLMALRPAIDSSALYFMESYAAEIVCMEFQFKLLRQMISGQILEERSIIHKCQQTLSESSVRSNVSELAQTVYGETEQGLSGYPYSHAHNQSISLNESATSVGMLEFFSSLSHVARLQPILDNIIMEFQRILVLSSPMDSMMLRRTILQQCLVEWRLVSDESAVLVEKGSSFTADCLFDNPVLYDSLVLDIIKHANDVDFVPKPNTLSGRATKPGLNPLGSRPWWSFKPKYLHIYAKALDLVCIRNRLLDALFESELLAPVYLNQMQIAEIDSPSIYLEPLRFEEGILADKLKGEDATPHSAYPRYAIMEFELGMAILDFNSYESVKSMFKENEVEFVRRALQIQIVHKNSLISAIQYNQFLLDPYIQKFPKAENTFVTSVPETTMETAEKTAANMELLRKQREYLVRLIPYFTWINNLKNPIRKTLQHNYNDKSIRIIKTQKAEFVAHKLRELKYDLLLTYCQEMMTSIPTFSLRTQLARQIGALRELSREFPPEETPFTTGSDPDNDLIGDGQISYRKSRDESQEILVMDDGKVGNVWHVAHPKEAVKLLSHARPALQSSGLRGALKIVSYLRDIVTFIKMQSRLSLSPLDSTSVVGIETAYNELIKLKSELSHLSDATDLNSVVLYLSLRRKLYFQKFLLMLYNLHDTMVQREQLHPSVLKTIQRECSRLLLPQSHHMVADSVCDPIFIQDPLRVPGRAIYDISHVLSVLFSHKIPRSQSARQRQLQSQSTMFVGMHQPVLYPVANIFLAGLPDSDRNYANGEMMAIDLQFEDILMERGIYYASQPEAASNLQSEFITSSLSLRQLKYFYILSALQIPMPQEGEAYKRMLSFYNENVWSKAISVLKKHKEMEGGGSEALDGQLPKSELLIRQFQVEILKQEIDKLLVHIQTSDVSIIYGHLIAESEESVATSESHIHDSVNAADHEAKQRMLRDFVFRLMLNAPETRTETGDRGFILPEFHIRSCISHLSKDLLEWSNLRWEEHSKTRATELKRLQHLLYVSERNLKYSEYLREQEQKAVHRKVQTEVADKGYDLIFEIDSLNRKLVRSEEELKRQEDVVREQVKREYDDLVRQLTVEAMDVKAKFKEYRSQLQQDIMTNLFDAKKEALKKMVNSSNTPIELKRKTMKMVSIEEELNELRSDKISLEILVTKLKSMNRLRTIAAQSAFSKKLRKLEDEKNTINKSLWETRDEMEQKEAILRQQLAASQRALSNREQEIDVLRKELDQQQRSKNTLIQWKVSKTHQLAEMESKLAQYEKWKNLNVDKLLLDLEKKEADLRKYTQSEDRAAKQTEITEMRAQKELARIKIELTKEKKLKQDAFFRLEELKKKTDEAMAATEGSAR
eukprot:TRINITY_DN1137_c0_g1_i1.p1 TRINITY_DN1137_c0_g1~~TRINITY_DN1137_c0_g1_i1.p1  ORF type:complete len:2066 (-),score=432.43 TRINITY_DN1137_c0_g1_i1:1174-7371(-)